MLVQRIARHLGRCSRDNPDWTEHWHLPVLLLPQNILLLSHNFDLHQVHLYDEGKPLIVTSALSIESYNLRHLSCDSSLADVNRTTSFSCAAFVSIISLLAFSFVLCVSFLHLESSMFRVRFVVSRVRTRFPALSNSFLILLCSKSARRGKSLVL